MLVGWLVAGLVQSVATVTFTGPPTMALIFGLVGIVGALSADGAPRKDQADEPKAAPAREPHEAGARAVRR
jgi:xanthosine utilization system XapX-like protein